MGDVFNRRIELSIMRNHHFCYGSTIKYQIKMPSIFENSDIRGSTRITVNVILTDSTYFLESIVTGILRSCEAPTGRDSEGKEEKHTGL
jgi:hypothetical protein